MPQMNKGGKFIFGKSLIFVAMAEGIALYGLIISFMIIGQLG